MNRTRVLRGFLGTNAKVVSKLLRIPPRTHQNSRRVRAMSAITTLLENLLPNIPYYAIHWDQIVEVFFEIKVIKTVHLSKEGVETPTVIKLGKERGLLDVLTRIFKLAGWSMSAKGELWAAAASLVGLILGYPSTGIEIAVAMKVAYRILVLVYFYQTIIKRSKPQTIAHLRGAGQSTENYIRIQDSLFTAVTNLTAHLLYGLSHLLPDEIALGVGAVVSIPGLTKEAFRTQPRVRDTSCNCVGTCSYDYLIGMPTCYINKGSEKRCIDYSAPVYNRLLNLSEKKAACNVETGRPAMQFYPHGNKKHKAAIKRAKEREAGLIEVIVGKKDIKQSKSLRRRKKRRKHGKHGQSHK